PLAGEHADLHARVEGAPAAGLCPGAPPGVSVRLPTAASRWVLRSSRCGSRTFCAVAALFLAFSEHELGAEYSFRLELIMAPTAKSEVVLGCRSAAGYRHDVIQLESPAGFAPPAALAHEGASTLR